MPEKKLATESAQDDPQARPGPADRELDELQEENAATSLDQPSEDVG